MGDSNVAMEGCEQQADSDIFVPPSPGADPILEVLRQNPQNAAL
jgi:hypothetical protein